MGGPEKWIPFAACPVARYRWAAPGSNIQGKIPVALKNGSSSRRAPLQDTDGQHLAAISRARYQSPQKMAPVRDVPRCKIPMGSTILKINQVTMPPGVVYSVEPNTPTGEAMALLATAFNDNVFGFAFELLRDQAMEVGGETLNSLYRDEPNKPLSEVVEEVDRIFSTIENRVVFAKRFVSVQLRPDRLVETINLPCEHFAQDDRVNEANINLQIADFQNGFKDGSRKYFRNDRNEQIGGRYCVAERYGLCLLSLRRLTKRLLVFKKYVQENTRGNDRIPFHDRYLTPQQMEVYYLFLHGAAWGVAKTKHALTDSLKGPFTNRGMLTTDRRNTLKQRLHDVYISTPSSVERNENVTYRYV